MMDASMMVIACVLCALHNTQPTHTTIHPYHHHTTINTHTHTPKNNTQVSADRFAELAGVSVDTLTSQVSGIKRKQWDADALIIDTGDLGSMRGWGVADWMVDNIAHSESKAERSLMHRYVWKYSMYIVVYGGCDEWVVMSGW